MNDLPADPGRAASLPLHPPGAEATGPGVLDAFALLAGASEVLIRLDEALYRLRRTRNGRLILTK